MNEQTPRKLKAREVADVRARLLAEQHGRCDICQLPIAPGQAVLDHDHHTGAVRSVLHSGCNSLLGKIENNAPRFGVANRLAQFCSGVAGYLRQHAVDQTGLLHPTHKSEEDRRLQRNKKARAARAARAAQ